MVDRRSFPGSGLETTTMMEEQIDTRSEPWVRGGTRRWVLRAAVVVPRGARQRLPAPQEPHEIRPWRNSSSGWKPTWPRVGQAGAGEEQMGTYAEHNVRPHAM